MGLLCVVANREVLDGGLELSKPSIASDPRVINTLSSGTESHHKVQTVFPYWCS
jgi:hypothetical protein